MKDTACIMNINKACKNFHTCYNYKMQVSENLRNTQYEKPFLLLGGCPSMNENPDDCKFYKEILRFNKIDADFYKKN